MNWKNSPRYFTRLDHPFQNFTACQEVENFDAIFEPCRLCVTLFPNRNSVSEIYYKLVLADEWSDIFPKFGPFSSEYTTSDRKGSLN